ncbi:TerB family tellurite resistance protein [Pedobacter lithocola]|uniref:TerB family tellurite resistance protein n=1 Tax=Pedobacter lithocola TaxID=1908239 RepID=A0ABV8PEE4_9SPHI
MKSIRILLPVLLLLATASFSRAQSTEVQQLLLNVEKLSQFKNILSDMKKGYQIVSTGYNAVRNISQGNFSLHEVFIDGLMLVSPEVRKYHKVAGIITYQKDIVSEYKTAFGRFKSSGTFSEQEINYLSKVYGQLFDQSVNNLDALMNVVTSSKLRMSDDERLQAIDKIFADTQDKLSFLRDFNKQASLLNLQRQKEKNDIQTLQKIYQP